MTINLYIFEHIGEELIAYIADECDGIREVYVPDCLDGYDKVTDKIETHVRFLFNNPGSAKNQTLDFQGVIEFLENHGIDYNDAINKHISRVNARETERTNTERMRKLREERLYSLKHKGEGFTLPF